MKVNLLVFLLTVVRACNVHGNSAFKRMNMRVAPAIAASLCFAYSCLATDIQHVSPTRGKELFEKSCLGCHSGGGNLFGGKTLKKEALLSNKVLEPSKMAELILRGKGMMPAYGEFVSPMGNTMPAKLSNDDTHAVVDYIIQQADQNWKME